MKKSKFIGYEYCPECKCETTSKKCFMNNNICPNCGKYLRPLSMDLLVGSKEIKKFRFIDLFK